MTRPESRSASGFFESPSAQDVRTVTRQELLQVQECPVCGVTFALPERLVRARQQDKGRVYCTNGHRLCFAPPPRQAERPVSAGRFRKLQVQLCRAKHALEQAEARLAESNDAAP